MPGFFVFNVEWELLTILTSRSWTDYELIDAACGEKLERWGNVHLIRPDPQVIWNTQKTHPLWQSADAAYLRSSSGGGKWEYRKQMPEKWKVAYKDLRFQIKPTGFKHTGLFPEQAENWDFCMDKIKQSKRDVRVLNLFAYTGGATVACAWAGAHVCHVDAAQGMVSWAKENVAASGLSDRPVRYIVDDCIKFVEREIRRGKTYDAVIMDPPSYGRGPDGSVWKIEDNLYALIELTMSILSDDPLFYIVNSYTTGLAPGVLNTLLTLFLTPRYGGRVLADELGLCCTAGGYVLPCGSTGRWEI